jgi:hypothetical protein
MMQYRLRTLLILMAISGLVFARIGYLTRMADYHHRAESQVIQEIAGQLDGEFPPEMIRAQLAFRGDD